MVVNGNVDGFEIRDNTVRDCDNIGIDCIGFEKVSPNAATDQARNGIVAGNQVYNIATKNNPAYDSESSAGGIYVDGGDSIVIERNHVHHCDFGIEVASEHKGKITRQITVRNNLLRENLQAGLIMGGYNRKTTGAAEDCIITNNTFYNNDTVTSGDEWGQIYLQFRVSRCTFANNILYHDISKGKQFNVFIVHWNTTGSQNSFDHNQFYGPATPVWILKNKWKEGWPEYLADSVSGTNEQFGDPLLTGVSGGNWMPAVKSPVVDSGSNAVISTNEIDFDGQPRIRNRIVDRGAAEYFGP